VCAPGKVLGGELWMVGKCSGGRCWARRPALGIERQGPAPRELIRRDQDMGSKRMRPTKTLNPKPETRNPKP
jgi:hypothetical protein